MYTNKLLKYEFEAHTKTKYLEIKEIKLCILAWKNPSLVNYTRLTTRNERKIGCPMICTDTIRNDILFIDTPNNRVFPK